MKLTRLHVCGQNTGIKVFVTETAHERMRGLLGRDHMPPDQALLLKRCRSIHTFGMGFAIDVLFLDRHARIAAIHHDVPKRRMLLNLRAIQTLEMSSGAARLHGLSVGDSLAFEVTS